VNGYAWTDRQVIPKDTDILVNATPIGFIDATQKPDIDYDTLTSNMIVCDVIPNTTRTLFLAEAEKRKCRIFHGMQMLVNQGAIAFTIWTGIPAPTEIMFQALQTIYGK